MPVRPSDLRAVPLFADITDEHLTQLLGAFERHRLEEGAALFHEGSVADRLLVLVEGELVVRQAGADTLRLRPIAPVGELGALTGLRRTSTVSAAKPSEVLSLSTEALLRFFETHGDVAYPFHHNLLHVVADKLVRDQHRLDEMRQNLISTQKSMKRMREALLDADDTPLHRMLFEELDALIEQNRKGHYLVDVTRALPVDLRLDDGSLWPVLRLSNEWAYLAPQKDTPTRGTELAGVLVAPDVEIPVSGTIEETSNDRVVLCLDLLIDDYGRALESLLARLLLLDLVLLGNEPIDHRSRAGGDRAFRVQGEERRTRGAGRSCARPARARRSDARSRPGTPRRRGGGERLV
jgi:CRP/FNR family transcriptional regulator, cyclic AMP receptor protein